MILSGYPVAQEIYDSLDTTQHPHLAIIQVGTDPASQVYTQKKQEVLEKHGGQATLYQYPSDISQKDLEKQIIQFNYTSSIHGIIVQLPLPQHINTPQILSYISPEKDPDGLTPQNLAGCITSTSFITPATPLAVLSLCRYYTIPLTSQHIVVINDSLLLGRPLIHLLTNHGATVTMAHKNTPNLKNHLTQANIIISGIGKPHIITDIDSTDKVLIDVGISRTPQGIKGDFHPTLYSQAAMYTPVPGGIGPITVACLISNLYSVTQNYLNT